MHRDLLAFGSRAEVDSITPAAPPHGGDATTDIALAAAASHLAC